MRNLFFVVLFLNLTFAFEYNLKPIKLSDNSYYFYGKEEYFSKQNGGDIANSAFIITKNSVILIDTGTTVDYANSMKKEISKITKKPIKYVINTHHHPDHFLGNKAFEDAKIYATQHTIDDIKNNGEKYVSNMVNLIGEAVYSTRAMAPNTLLETKKLILDNYELEIFYLDGHTQSDIVILDKNTKILYASDLIFNQRALATPHANLEKWVLALKELKKLDFEILVPGHGKATFSKEVIDENIRYLTFLDKTLKDALDNGLDTFEILSLEVPEDIKNYSMFEEEYERTIINLYKKYELKYSY